MFGDRQRAGVIERDCGFSAHQLSCEITVVHLTQFGVEPDFN